MRVAAMTTSTRTWPDCCLSVAEYCSERKTCRRKMIAAAFGEPWSAADCAGKCDNCAAMSAGAGGLGVCVCLGGGGLELGFGAC